MGLKTVKRGLYLSHKHGDWPIHSMCARRVFSFN